jgi:hypothetical protein
MNIAFCPAMVGTSPWADTPAGPWQSAHCATSSSNSEPVTGPDNAHAMLSMAIVNGLMTPPYVLYQI